MDPKLDTKHLSRKNGFCYCTIYNKAVEGKIMFNKLNNIQYVHDGDTVEKVYLDLLRLYSAT